VRSGQAGHKVPQCRPPDSCLVHSTDLQDSASRIARHAERPETISLGMSESTCDQRMTPGLAPVAFVDLTVPKATEGGKSAQEGMDIEDKGKDKAEEWQDT